MKKDKSGALGWIAAQSRFMLFPILALVAVSAAASVCSVYFALLSRNVVNAAVYNPEPSVLVREASKLAALILIEIVLRVLNSRMSVKYGAGLELSLRRNAFETVLKKHAADIKYHSGETVNRIRSDSSVIAQGVLHILPQGAMLVTKLVGAIVVLLTIDYQFALILLAFAPFILIFGRFYSRKMKKFHKAVQLSEGKSVSFMMEAVQNIAVIKAFECEKGQSDELGDIQNETYLLRLKRNAWSLIANVSLLLIFTGGYAFGVIWGAFKLTRGMEFGSFTAMLQLVNQVQTPVRSIGGLFVDYQNMIASAERVMELTASEPENKEPKRDFKALYDRLNAVMFENVTFAYDGENVLQNADLRIEKGSFTAISGISGGGKSTSVKLLLALAEPNGGEVYFDTADGKINIDASCRGMFSYVPQGNLLLSGSIAKNIDFYGGASPDEIKRAARDADIADVIESLPNGYETRLGEKGAGLSEGQIQRVAVARALARNAPILLLDEATSALDEATELALLTALKKRHDKTVIIITHRKKVFDFCSGVFYLKKR